MGQDTVRNKGMIWYIHFFSPPQLHLLKYRLCLSQSCHICGRQSLGQENYPWKEVGNQTLKGQNPMFQWHKQVLNRTQSVEEGGGGR